MTTKKLTATKFRIMNAIFLLTFIIVSITSFISCDDNVNPKSELQEIYALNCILRGDSTYQVATISKAYDVDGFDPSANTNETFVAGATIKVYYRNSVFVFRDTLLQRPANSKLKTLMPAYYTKEFSAQYPTTVKIEAILPNNKLLTAESETFSPSLVYLFAQSPIIPPPANPNGQVRINWYESGIPKSSKGLYYSPELVIHYTKEVNGVKTKHEKKIPKYYQNSGGSLIAIYPQIETNVSSALFDMDAVKKSLDEISEGDSQKSNYTIDKAIFSLLIMDRNLAVYYASQRTYLDEFSVRFSQPEFTNVVGGLGIFGSYIINRTEFTFTSSFIESFGYKTK